MSKPECDVKVQAEGRCRLCLRSSTVRPLTRHRVVQGRYGGRYVPANCVPLCRPCHELVDSGDRVVRAQARRMLRAVLWPVEIAHAITRFGEEGFDGHYPKPGRALVLERRALARDEDEAFYVGAWARTA